MYLEIWTWSCALEIWTLKYGLGEWTWFELGMDVEI